MARLVLHLLARDSDMFGIVGIALSSRMRRLPAKKLSRQGAYTDIHLPYVDTPCDPALLRVSEDFALVPTLWVTIVAFALQRLDLFKGRFRPVNVSGWVGGRPVQYQINDYTCIHRAMLTECCLSQSSPVLLAA